MNTNNTLSAGSLWSILPSHLDAMLAIDVRSNDFNIDTEARRALTAANRSRRSAQVQRNIAVLPLMGILSQRPTWMSELFGGTSTDRFGREFDALVADSSVDAIVLDVDSPGGNYPGVPELASKILAARGSKPIVAVANSMAASAAYWIASAADELVVTPSGDVGSIGVLWVHEDYSGANERIGVKPTYIAYGQHKTEANPDGPLSSEAREHIQRQVDDAGRMFERSVAKHRGTTPQIVHDTFGQGRTYSAREAVARGMADRIGTLEAEVDRLASAQRLRSGRKSRRTAMRRQRLELLAQ